MSDGLSAAIVYDTVRAALAVLFVKDGWLLEDDVNERSISHRLAIYLEEEIKRRGDWPSDLHVDCEYNRDVNNPNPPYSKKLDLPERYNVSNEDTEATTVFPDIIVHRRRSDCNVLVLEMKKHGGRKDAADFDRQRKVPAYLNELGYRFGVFLSLRIGNAVGGIGELTILERTETGIVRRM